MKKPTIQEGALESEVQEPRKLNMEEKRKLEKLLLSDIDSAVARYNAQAEDMRRTLIDKLTKNPPAKAKKLFESYSPTQKQAKQLKSKLAALGFDIGYDGPLRTANEALGTRIATAIGMAVPAQTDAPPKRIKTH